LTFLRARHLRNATGRFLSGDRLAGRTRVPMSLHRSGYGNGNPVMYFDRAGQEGAMVELQAGVYGTGTAATQAVGAVSAAASYIKGAASAGALVAGIAASGYTFRDTKKVDPIVIPDAAPDLQPEPQSDPGKKTKLGTDYSPGTKFCPKHHIVPRKDMKNAQPARDLLETVGIGINEETNLVVIDVNLHIFIHAVWLMDPLI
jgi:hypothetical protein